MSKKHDMIYLLSPLQKEGTIPLPMITFRLLEKELDLSDCDTLMFTSKQAVKSANALNRDWIKIPCLAIGAATAREIESLGGKVLYQPHSFYGETLSQDIITMFHDKKILYLRPKEVSFDSKTFLERSGITLLEQVIYETSCILYETEEKPVKHAIVIFTSPSTIHCFLKNFDWDKSYTAVVIGNATKVHLPKNANFVVADEPSIASCVKKAEEI